MQKTAPITGLTGQDGSSLAELLLSKGCRMIGLVRRSSLVFRTRIEHRNRELSMLRSDFYVLAYGDMSDGSSLRKVMNRLNAARFTKS